MPKWITVVVLTAALVGGSASADDAAARREIETQLAKHWGLPLGIWRNPESLDLGRALAAHPAVAVEVLDARMRAADLSTEDGRRDAQFAAYLMSGVPHADSLAKLDAIFQRAQGGDCVEFRRSLIKALRHHSILGPAVRRDPGGTVKFLENRLVHEDDQAALCTGLRILADVGASIPAQLLEHLGKRVPDFEIQEAMRKTRINALADYPLRFAAVVEWIDEYIADRVAPSGDYNSLQAFFVATLIQDRARLRRHGKEVRRRIDECSRLIAALPEKPKLAPPAADPEERLRRQVLWGRHSRLEAVRSCLQLVLKEDPLAQHPGHSDPVLAVAWVPDSAVVASSDGSGLTRIGVLPGGFTRAALKGHDGHVFALAFSPDGKRLFSAGADKTIRVWSVEQGLQIGSMVGHENVVYSVAFSGRSGPKREGEAPADLAVLVSGSADGTVRVWDADTGKELNSRKFADRVFAVAVTGDGKLVAAGLADGSLKLWRPGTGVETAAAKRHDQRINSVAFSPDGKTLYTGGADGKLIAWNPSTGQPRDGGAGGQAAGGTIPGVQSVIHEITSLSVSPDGKRVALTTVDGMIHIHDAATLAEVESFRAHVGRANCVAYSPDGKLLATGGEDKLVKLWTTDPAARDPAPKVGPKKE